ncbi:MAG: SAM-dependent methyltransferase, partial [Pseudomonadota bacterium]
ILGNEFLDALPSRQYVKSKNVWRERCVGLDDNEDLTWVLGSGVLASDDLPTGHAQEPDGSVFEISTIRESFVERLCDLISENKGAALLIDYGHGQSGFGDTFQAVADHQFTDPLMEPGLADLTSHVDFEPLMKIASGKHCQAMPLVTQGEFLLEMGLLERAGLLGADKSHEDQQAITRQAERLALPDQMGNLFKVLAISSGPELWPFAKSS